MSHSFNIKAQSAALVPIASLPELDGIVEELLVQVFPPRRPVRLLGIALSSFISAIEEQASQISTRQYARLVDKWITAIGLPP